MVEVEELFAGRDCKTRLWLSETARAALGEFTARREQPRGAFLQKLERYATAGFRHYEGDKKPVRHEWNQIYRISDGGLFRLIGFYENEATKADFIVIDAVRKRGEKLSASERATVDRVASVRRDKSWRKKDADGHNYPRLAEGT